MTVYVMWMYSLLYGLISVVQRLLENSTVLCSVSRFELLNEQAGGTGYSLSQVLLLSIFNLTGFSLLSVFSQDCGLITPSITHLVTFSKYQKDSDH